MKHNVLFRIRWWIYAVIALWLVPISILSYLTVISESPVMVVISSLIIGPTGLACMHLFKWGYAKASAPQKLEQKT